MEKKKNTKKVAAAIMLIVFMVLVLLFTILLGAIGGAGPFAFIQRNQVKKLAGNNEIYALESVQPLEESPLKGKTLCFLGSSVTLGAKSLDVSFVDYIGRRNDCSCVKEAVSGTTLVDSGSKSYIKRMKSKISPDAEFDAFICQLSTNDAGWKKKLGKISDSESLEDFDTSTVIGAMEYIIVYARQTWNCPVIFYTGTKYESEHYQKMVDALLELQKKYGIGVIDLWNDAELNAVSEEEYGLYMADSIHPTQAGYRDWWTPKMEQELYLYLRQDSKSQSWGGD